MSKCPQCGAFYPEKLIEGDICCICRLENAEDAEAIRKLMEEGHPEHCAQRQVWGDGECECHLYSGYKYDPYNWLKETNEDQR